MPEDPNWNPFEWLQQLFPQPQPQPIEGAPTTIPQWMIDELNTLKWYSEPSVKNNLQRLESNTDRILTGIDTLYSIDFSQYALKSDIPDLSPFALKKDVDDIRRSLNTHLSNVAPSTVIIDGNSSTVGDWFISLNTSLTSLQSQVSSIDTMTPEELSAYLDFSTISGISPLTYGGKTLREWTDNIVSNNGSLTVLLDAVNSMNGDIGSIMSDLGKVYTKSDVDGLISSNITNLRVSTIPADMRNTSSDINIALKDALDGFSVAYKSDVPTDNAIVNLIGGHGWGFFGKNIVNTTDDFWNMRDKLLDLSNNANPILNLVDTAPQPVPGEMLVKYVSPIDGKVFNSLTEYQNYLNDLAANMTTYKLPVFSITEEGYKIYYTHDEWYSMKSIARTRINDLKASDPDIVITPDPIEEAADKWHVMWAEDADTIEYNVTNPYEWPYTMGIGSDESTIPINSDYIIQKIYGINTINAGLGEWSDKMKSGVGLTDDDISTFQSLVIPYPLTPDIQDRFGGNLFIEMANVPFYEVPNPLLSNSLTSAADLRNWNTYNPTRVQAMSKMTLSDVRNAFLSRIVVPTQTEFQDFINAHYSPKLMAIDGTVFPSNTPVSDVQNYSLNLLNSLVGYNGTDFSPRRHIIEYLTAPQGIATIFSIKNATDDNKTKIDSIEMTLQNITAAVDYAIDPKELQQALDDRLQSYATLSYVDGVKSDIFTTFSYDPVNNKFTNPALFDVVYAEVGNEISTPNDPLNDAVSGVADDVGNSNIGTWMQGVNVQNLNTGLPDKNLPDFLLDIQTQVGNMVGVGADTVASVLPDVNAMDIASNLPDVVLPDFFTGMYDAQGWTFNSFPDAIDGAINGLTGQLGNLKSDLNSHLDPLAHMNNAIVDAKNNFPLSKIGVGMDVAWPTTIEQSLNSIIATLQSQRDYIANTTSSLHDLIYKQYTVNWELGSFTGTFFQMLDELVNRFTGPSSFGDLENAALFAGIMNIMRGDFKKFIQNIKPSLEYLKDFSNYMKTFFDEMFDGTKMSPAEATSKLWNKMVDFKNVLPTDKITIPVGDDYIPSFDLSQIRLDMPEKPSLPNGFTF